MKEQRMTNEIVMVFCRGGVYFKNFKTDMKSSKTYYDTEEAEQAFYNNEVVWVTNEID